MPTRRRSTGRQFSTRWRSVLTLYKPAGMTVEIIDNVATPPPDPAIVGFAAVPATLPAGGGSVTLNATVTNATSIKLDGVVVTLPVTVPVTATQAFTLVASGPAGTTAATASLTVTVAASPPVASTINLQSFTGGASGVPLLAFWRWCSLQRYDRFQTLVTSPGTGGSIRMVAVQLFNGTQLALGATTVTVTMTPVEGGAPIVLPPVTPSPTAKELTVTHPAVASGWYRLTATAPGWQVPAWYLYVPGGALPARMPVVKANWEFLHPPAGTPANTFIAADVMVPATFAPMLQPLAVRQYPDTAAIPTRANTVEEHLVPLRPEDVYRPAIAAANAAEPEGGAASARLPGVAGLSVAFNKQAYFEANVIGADTVSLPLLDGPRGRGTVFCAQHLQFGRVGQLYFADNFRVGRIEPDGSLRTLFGRRHRATPTLWTDTPEDLESVGDWSGVAGAKYPNEMWGMAWSIPSTATDPAASPIGGEQPHVTGPVLFVPDRQHGRILRATFSPTDRLAPPVMAEWKASAEPWDCVTDGANTLFVSEWAANRIASYDINTGALLASFPVTHPEGLFYQDGALYYGSLASKSIRKRTAAGADTLAWDLSSPIVIDGNSRYVKFCLSDGSFGPRGMAAVVTWSVIGYGYPQLFKTDGTKVSDSLYPGQAASGPGLPWHISSNYQTAVAIGHGRMAISGVQEGIRLQSKALPTDVTLPTAYFSGRDEYKRLGYRLTNGDNGFGHYGLPLPWGVSANIDVYLTAHGYTRT